MGIIGRKNKNNDFGNLVNLTPVVTTAEAREEDTTAGAAGAEAEENNIPNTTIMRISQQTYRLFVGHSRRYYDVEDYDTILRNLLKDFESHNQDKTWRDINE